MQRLFAAVVSFELISGGICLASGDAIAANALYIYQQITPVFKPFKKQHPVRLPNGALSGNERHPVASRYFCGEITHGVF